MTASPRDRDAPRGWQEQLLRELRGRETAWQERRLRELRASAAATTARLWDADRDVGPTPPPDA